MQATVLHYVYCTEVSRIQFLIYFFVQYSYLYYISNSFLSLFNTVFIGGGGGFSKIKKICLC